MGYKTKIQKVQRPTNKSFYVNMPAAIAEALEVEKGEEFEWTVEDKNTLVLKLNGMNRLSSLDTLRCIAILLVFIVHVGQKTMNINSSSI